MRTLKMLIRINYFFIIVSMFLSFSDIFQIFYYEKDNKKTCFNVPFFDKRSILFRIYWFTTRLITTLSA